MPLSSLPGFPWGGATPPVKKLLAIVAAILIIVLVSRKSMANPNTREGIVSDVEPFYINGERVE